MRWSKAPWYAMTALLVMASGAGQGLAAQAKGTDPVKMHTISLPRIGNEAPDATLPWATREGPGPVDQPFRLKAELGRVVVLLFNAGDGLLGQLADRADSLFRGDVVVAVVSRDSLSGSVQRANRFALPFKFLGDVDGSTSRRYGIGNAAAAGGAVAYVVSPLGRLASRVEGLGTGDPAGLERLGREVVVARGR